jgi:acetyltransferase EpsM
MKKLIILGGSGIGMIASSIAKENGEYDVCGFLNDVVETGSYIGKYEKIQVIGTTDDIPYYLDNDYYFFIAYVGLKKEKETFEKIEKFQIPRERYATLIHKTAIIPHGFCRIGYGVLMAPLSQISPDTTIEDNCLLLANSFLGHDSTMKRFSHLATNSVVGANVIVGRGVHVGSNSTVREKVNIGDFSLIGAGAVVLNDVNENTKVVGNPAKILNK